ncbi:MAG TPA: hypothetical protein VM054_03620 [bacterium]|nr:hypothetical protein [bacterium]
MLRKLYFDFRDVLRAPRLGFSAKKIWVQFTGLLIGLAGYAVLAYTSLLVAGASFAEIWFNYGALPIPLAFGPGGDVANYFVGVPWYSWLIWAVGVLWALVIALLAGTATAKLTYEQLRGNDFYSKKEAWRFARKNAAAVILSPVGLAILAAGLVFGGLVIGWFASWGAVSAWITAAFFPVIIGVTIFTLYLAVIIVVGVVIAPAVVATTKNDTFETIFELFSTVAAQPWRLFIYEFLLFLATLIAFGVFLVFILFALKLMKMVFGVWWGTDFTQYVLPQAQHYTHSFLRVPVDAAQVYFNRFLLCCQQQGFAPWFLVGNIPGIYWLLAPQTYSFIPIQPAAGLHVASIILAVGLIGLIGILASYLLATCQAGQTLIYVALRKKKDDENILERRDYDEEFPEFEVPEDLDEGEKPAEAGEKPEDEGKKEEKE